MQISYARKFIAGASLGMGILLAMGGFIMVRAIAPGITADPTFGPIAPMSLISGDVQVNFGIACNWAGEEGKQMACDPSGSSSGCVSMNVTCEDGVVTRMRSGVIFAGGGGINCSTSCSTVW